MLSVQSMTCCLLLKCFEVFNFLSSLELRKLTLLYLVADPTLAVDDLAEVVLMSFKMRT